MHSGDQTRCGDRTHFGAATRCGEVTPSGEAMHCGAAMPSGAAAARKANNKTEVLERRGRDELAAFFCVCHPERSCRPRFADDNAVEGSLPSRLMFGKNELRYEL